MSKPKPHQVFVINSQGDDPNPNIKESAEKRRQTINEQIDEFFSGGGKVQKLPGFGEKK